MRCWPYERHLLETSLSADEIRTRLAAKLVRSSWKRPPREAAFVGTVHDGGFQFVPLVWGQSSFLPQFFGRWTTTSSGTRVELQVVPNVALLTGLIIVFAFMGILVYDKNWIRVVATTGGNALLACLLLLVGFWVAAESTLRKLARVLDASPAPDSGTQKTPNRASGLTWRRGTSVTVALLILTAGCSLWQEVHSGRISLSMRPAVDLVTIAWTTLGLMVLWLFLGSGFSPISRIRCLLALFAVQIGWSWLATVDGYGGDGRPLFTWRWAARDESVDTTEEIPKLNTPGAVFVDLRSTGVDDCPAFRGRHRDGVVHGLQLNPDWEQHPPRIAWQQPIGIGWSSFAISGGFAVTQEQRGRDEAVVCYELATGRECWEHRDRARFHEMMGGDGPRATPTLDEGDVYSLGATGILNRLEGSTGSLVWSTNIVDEANAPTSLFGMTGSPLIVQDLVIVNPGGPAASLVAYQKQTGKRIWAAGSSPTAYASPQWAHLGNQDQVLTFNADGLFAHAVTDGSLLWSHPWVTPPEFNNVCQPVLWRDSAGAETIFLTSGYGKGCVLLEITTQGTKFVATPRWQNTNMKVKFSSVVERDGYVYGLDENILVCLDLRSGKRMWKGGRYGYGQVSRIDEFLLILTDEGEVVLCDATPDRHRERARWPVLNGRTWNHPAIAGDTLLIRNDRTAACLKLPVDLKDSNHRLNVTSP